MTLKKPTTFQQQIELLKKKNIIIEDYQESLSFLQRVNYYQFSAYYLPFRKSDGTCLDNITFQRIQKIYEFDQELRSLIMDIIEDIEVHIRTQLAYYHAHKYGELGYMFPNSFNQRHDHVNYLKHITLCIAENKNTLVVKHHMAKYDGHFPLWVIIEFFSIGMLSHFYRSLKTSDKKAISRILYNENYKNLESWMRCITDLRNKCAHYSRMYYWVFPAIPKMPPKTKYIPTRRLFAQLYMLKMMYPDQSAWEVKFMKPLRRIIKQYKPYISLQHLDFPYKWNSMLTK